MASHTPLTSSTTKQLFKPDMQICQDDYPLDWYQNEFLPYAEEYQALPDHNILTTTLWMEPYLRLR